MIRSKHAKWILRRACAVHHYNHHHSQNTTIIIIIKVIIIIFIISNSIVSDAIIILLLFVAIFISSVCHYFSALHNHPFNVFMYCNQDIPCVVCVCYLIINDQRLYRCVSQNRKFFPLKCLLHVFRKSVPLAFTRQPNMNMTVAYVCIGKCHTYFRVTNKYKYLHNI